VYHEDTKEVPVSHPPRARYAVGKSNKPLHPTNTNLSLFNQSSNKSNQPFCWLGSERVEEVITSIIVSHIYLNIC
jgi:hypothetical protein